MGGYQVYKSDLEYVSDYFAPSATIKGFMLFGVFRYMAKDKLYNKYKVCVYIFT